MKLFIPDTLRYDRDRIFTRLKITPDRENVYDYACEIFPRLESIAREETELLCGYTLVPNTLTGISPEPDSCPELAVCLTGCTERISRAVGQLLEEGDLLEGYILNDLANDILFHTSEAMNCQLYEEQKARGYHLTPRLTPGEGVLPLSRQQDLLDILLQKKPDLPVSLTERYMLRPEKAMLYAYGCGESLPDRPIGHDCANCANTTCFYRSK